ncbi:alpha/beta hydrolase [Lentzea guizhouensis]|uniref:alpha/beta hydrolase n=1 Tax=Lentzea guizhouensis TaxID=1586287 RepID=UPI0012B6AC0A|nr:alpha/beta hydrolase [Lentzea guizhouensis]
MPPFVSNAAAAVTLAARHGSTMPAYDEEVSFVVDGTTTYGTLHVPARRRGERLAAALLLPGSGPTDRDGNQPPALTPNPARPRRCAGPRRVATLRFDKYGTGRTGLGAFRAPQDIDYPVFVRQAGGPDLCTAAEVDRRRVAPGSEGGMTALVLAAQAPQHRRAAALVMLQPQALRLLDLLAMQLHDQIAQLVAAGQLSEQDGAAIDRAIDGAVVDLRAGRPVDTTAMPPALAALQVAGGAEPEVRDDRRRGVPARCRTGTAEDAGAGDLRRAGRPGALPHHGRARVRRGPPGGPARCRSRDDHRRRHVLTRAHPRSAGTAVVTGKS